MSRVARHALSAGTASALTRLTGLAREIVFAAVFGASMDTDAYLAAFRVPNLFRDLFAEGSMSNAFVPNFSKTAEEEGYRSAWALANALLGVVLVVLGVLVLAMVALSQGWVYLVAAGFAEVPGKVERTAQLVRILAPFLAGVSLASVFGGMLNVRGRFFLPALAPATFNAAVIAGCLVPASWQARVGLDPMVTVALASTAGGLLQAAVQLPTLRRLGFRLRPSLRGHPALRRLLAFLVPALIGVATIQVGVLIDVQLAATFGDGPVSWLGYAFRLVQIPITVFAGAVAVANLATLSEQVARDDRGAARGTLADAVSLVCFLVLPTATLLGLFAHPVVEVFYQRGAFTPADTAMTAALLQCYAVAVVALCVMRVVIPSFYAWGDPWTPMVVSGVAVVLKLPLALWLTRESMLGLLGIPVAHSILAVGEVLLLFVLLGRRTGGWSRGLGFDLARMTCATAVMGLAGWWAMGGLDELAPRLAALAGCGVLYLTVGWVLGIDQVRRGLGRARPGSP